MKSGPIGTKSTGMTDGSNQQSTPKRDLLLSLWDSVLREQLPERMFPWWQKLNTLSRDWVKHDSDRPVQEFLDAMSNQGQPDGPPPETAFYLRRALRLTQLLDHTFRTDPIDPPWSDDVILPCAEAVAAELKAAGHRPLRARPYPPYPQLTLVGDSNQSEPRATLEQQRIVREIAELISHWDSRGESLIHPDLGRAVRGQLVRLWQHHRPGKEREGLLWELYHFRHYLGSGDSIGTLAAINDSFADIVHIDPRFANFIPFAGAQSLVSGRLGQFTPLEYLGFGLSAPYGVFRDSLFVRLSCLREVLALNMKFARYGSKTMHLHGRLSTGDPAKATLFERSVPECHLSQIVQHIHSRLARFTDRLRDLEQLIEDKDDTILKPGLMPPVPAIGEVVPYTSSSQLLLDLKQLHQAVGEAYGGVAFTPAVRRTLITAGLTRLHGVASNVSFEALTVEDVASEIGIRAGLLREPIATMSPTASTEAATVLAANPGKLASIFDAASLTEHAVQTLGFLRAARWQLANVDPEAVSCIVLSNVNHASEPLAALALMAALDAEPLSHGNSHGNGLTDRVSIVIGVSQSSPVGSIVAMLEELLQSPPFATYLQSRGGHIEVMLQRDHGTPTGAAYTPYLSPADILRCRALVRAITMRCKGTTVTFALALSDAWSADKLIACFPPDTLNQHLRLIAPSDTARLMSATTHAVRQLFDAPLAELTRQSWLNRTPETPDDIGAESNALNAIESAWQSMLADHAAAGVTPESHPDWFAAIEPWLGIEHVASLPKPANPANRFPAVALGLAADAMHRHHPRSLSMLAWRTLPKGAYSRLFPAIERAWHTAQFAIDAAEHWPRTPTLTATLANADAILAMLPEEAS